MLSVIVITGKMPVLLYLSWNWAARKQDRNSTTRWLNVRSTSKLREQIKLTEVHGEIISGVAERDLELEIDSVDRGGRIEFESACLLVGDLRQQSQHHRQYHC